MADRFPLILNTSNNQIQEIASGDQLDLSGNNVANAGIITATTFSGNLTGNVTGNINGNLTGTLQTAAQPNITSLGTLSSLNVSGNASIGGVLTYEDVTNVDSVGIITARDDIKITTDNKSIIMGAGADLSMKHDGTNSYILNNTGSFIISADTVQFNNRANTETKAKLINNGAVELYFDNSKVFETRNAGCTITGGLICGGALFNGNVNVPDNYVFSLGSSNDLQLYHNGSNSYISNRGAGSLVIESTTGEAGIILTQNGSVALRHDNSLKFETTGAGVLVSGNIYANDNNKFIAGTSNDLSIYHDGSHSYIDNNTGSLRFRDAGGAEKFRISGSGTQFNDDITLSNDNDKIIIGAGSDLQIFHTGSASKINNATGSLFIQSDAMSFHGDGGSETMATFAKNGAVALYYDNVKTLETTVNALHLFGNTSECNIDLKLSTGVRCGFLGFTSAGRVQINGASGGNAYETYLEGNLNGSTKLFYDNSVRIETLTEGAKVKRHSGGSTTLYVAGAEGGSAIIDMFADDGDDNADKYRLTTSSGGGFYLQNYASGSWETNIEAIGDGAVNLYHDNAVKFKTNASGVEFEKCILGGSIRTPAESSITYHQSFDSAAIFYPEGGYGNNGSPSNNRQAVIIGNTKGNWVEGNSSANHRSNGIKFSRIVNNSEYIRAGIAHDINSTEKFKFWTSYADIHFRTRNGNDGNQTWEECDRDPLVMHHNGHVSMCHMAYAKYGVGSDSDTYKTTETEHVVDGGSATTENGMSVDTSNGRITVPYTGKYLITANIGITVNANTFRTRLNLMKNGSDVIRTEHQEGTSTNGGWKDHVISAVIQMSANDYFSFDCRGKHDGGTYGQITCQLLHGTATT